MELELKSWFVRKNRLGSIFIEGEVERQTKKAVFFNGIATVKPSNICCKCGKLLTDPVSIELGIGPICAGIDQRHLMSQKDNFIKIGEGGVQPNISREKLINYIIPIPPYSEQIEIPSGKQEGIVNTFYFSWLGDNTLDVGDYSVIVKLTITED